MTVFENEAKATKEYQEIHTFLAKMYVNKYEIEIDFLGGKKKAVIIKMSYLSI